MVELNKKAIYVQLLIKNAEKQNTILKAETSLVQNLYLKNNIGTT